jgi:hypothetical protein
MTQTIDPAKLRAAAEHLEWVLDQYPDNDDVQSLLRALRPLLEDAKAGRITQPIDSHNVPAAYSVGEGRYAPFRHPNVGQAYVSFGVALRGGYTEQEHRILAKIEAMRGGA